MFRKLVTIAAITVLAGSPLLADFSYQETSTITGGMMASMMKVVGVFSKTAREPIKTTISVKGNRMASRSNNHATIMDLNTQTITSVDLQKKTYSVMTFEEMKQALDSMAERMKQKDVNADMKFKVSADATGKSKQIDGLDTKEMIVKLESEITDKKSGQTGTMNINIDSWIAPSVPGYQEVRDFYKRMAERLAWTPGGNMFMNRPDVAKGMSEAYKEVAKLDGIPVLQTVTMGGAGQPGMEGASAPPPQQQQQQQQQAERPSLGGALGGALGGRFGLGKKKTQSPPPDSGSAPAESQAAPSTPGSLLEMTIQLSTFSSGPVDDSQFAIPVGFKQVDSELKKAMK